MTPVEDHERRLSALEQSVHDHHKTADRYFQRNDEMHDKLWEKLDRIENRLLRSHHFALGALFIIGAVAGFIVKEWEWVTRHMGH